ncbi:FMN-binding protein [Clostridium sp. 'deep sea']|uniref:FMN-binding protein n=1 Tax=Clostridium sp. 'deep sea' TaxID=2779445 RepID=UPI0018966DF3|nr:FMN-binding protein [Clostridium sp. 'deep sea']QOR35401.1 FMN-binding protein [Clostridium sp. 'deep sea']
MKEQGYSVVHRVKKAETSNIIRVYKTKEGSIVQIVHSEGYKSTIELLVAINNNYVEKVNILSQHETEDYGGYIKEQWFLNRLCLPITPKLNLIKINKVNANDVVAVTGATISSQAVVDGVNLCIDNYGGLKDE